MSKPPSGTGSLPHVYVVNLERHAERRARMAQECQAIGLRPEFFPAVDASALVSLPSHRSNLATGEVGCLLSHRELLAQISQDADGYVLVLEDDVHFFPGFEDSLASAVKEARAKKAGFVQLGWLPLANEPDRLMHLKERVAAQPRVRRIAHTFHPATPVKAPRLQRRDPLFGTHCYLVSGGFAEVIAGFAQGRILAPYDFYLRALARLTPDLMWRARFPLAGQVWTEESSVNPNRVLPGYQIDHLGRIRRRPDL